MDSVMFSSATDEWFTPPHIIKMVCDVFGHIDLDPCSPPVPNVTCNMYYTAESDGLSKEWFGNVYMNPPYGREITKWVDKLYDEVDCKNVTNYIALVPARTDTKWFKKMANMSDVWCAVSGRLKFSNSKNSAPFPSAIFMRSDDYDDEIYKFCVKFSEIGLIFKSW